jgi:hypothetical protein
MTDVRRLLAVAVILLVAAGPVHGQIISDIVDSEAGLSAVSVDRIGKRAIHETRADTVPGTFTGVAAEFIAEDPDAAASFRFRIDGTWSEWHPATLVRSATSPTVIAGYRRDIPIDAEQFEVRVSADAGSLVEIRSAGVFDGRGDADSRPAGALQPLVGKKTGQIIPPPLITRADWGAEPFRGTPVPLANPTYDFMTWHHAAGYSAENREEGEAQMRAIQQLHQDVRGWSDVGYHFAIDRAGNLYQGRPFMDNSTNLSQVPVLARGAHVGERNTGNVGVVIMGCYHPPEGSYCEQEITPEAFNTYIVLFSFLSERYDIEPSMIRGHRDFSSTACPGDNNYVLIPTLIEEVVNLLEVGNEPIAEGTLQASADDEGVVTLDWNITEDFGLQTVEIERVKGDVRTVVFSGDGVPDTWSDATLVGGEEVTYVLYALDDQGRRQELARADVALAEPSGYALTSSFPNPASGEAEFKYYLPTEGQVTVGLYDASGRLVQEVESAYRDGDSWYTSRIDLSGRAAGLYFYRITVKGFSGVVFDRSRAVAVVR